MFDTVNLGAFVVAGLLLNVTPGADLLYIAGRSAGGGVKAGMVAALGIGVGCFFHILFAAFGLSMLLATSAAAFTVVKMVGAAYLVYLGVTSIWSARDQRLPGETMVAEPCRQGHGGIFAQAILVNALNPKVALFFLAFLPQFVAPQATQPALSFLFLGCLFNINGTVVNLLFALAASGIAARFRGHGHFGRLLKSAVGVLFIALGLRLAISSQR
jgi:threonine/homoserine/homoserine lactone efflux protein